MSEWELELVDIPNPCTVPWESMTGDERVRFCKHCSKNVYNLSDMSRTDARNLLISSEGKICISMLKRADGTVVTDECPPILRPARNAGRRVLSAATTAFAFLIALSAQIAKAAPDAADGNKNKTQPGCVPGQPKPVTSEAVRMGGAPPAMPVGADWKPPQNTPVNTGETEMPARKFTLVKSADGNKWTSRAIAAQFHDAKLNEKNELPPDMEAYLNHVLRKLKHAYTPAMTQSKASKVLFTITRDGSISGLKVENSLGGLADDLAIGAVKHAAPFRPLPLASIANMTIQFNPNEL